MSKRREVGDLVWLKPCSGFVAESHLKRVEVLDKVDGGCLLSCGDPACEEWDCWTVADEPGGERYPLYHVSECQMLDEPYAGGSDAEVPTVW
jgi:hypothetical protein